MIKNDEDLDEILGCVLGIALGCLALWALF